MSEKPLSEKLLVIKDEDKIPINNPPEKTLHQKLDTVDREVKDFFHNLSEFMLKKNTNYANAVYEPQGVFSQQPPDEQMKIRLDDKIKRIQNMLSNPDLDCGDESVIDTMDDMIAYLTYIRIYHKVKERGAAK